MAFFTNFTVEDDDGTGNNVTHDLTGTVINSYARVTAIEHFRVTIDLDTARLGTYGKFEFAAPYLFHVSASVSGDTKHLGKWMTGTIGGIHSNVVNLTDDLTKIIPSDELDKYHCQLIAVADFNNLTLNAGSTITPIPYDTTKHYGGIVAIRCNDTLTFNGGHISLTDCGVPTATKTLRPITMQEQNGTLDSDQYAGYENSQTQQRFLLNAGDGAAFLVAGKVVVADNSSRIGNVSTGGVQFCRGATDSPNLPSGVTNIGGSTILLAARTLENFNPAFIAKYRSSTTQAGQGICRCYIASATKLLSDEKLYAYDRFGTPAYVDRDFNIRDFGRGNFAGNTTSRLNNYATVTKIDGAKVSYTNKTTDGLAKIERGALVMIHANHKSTDAAFSGRFFLAKVWQDDGSTLTLNAMPTKFFNDFTLDDYALQIVSIPQYKDFTLAATNSATPKFNGSQGGIFAVTVADTCDLRGGTIDVAGKGGSISWQLDGNAQMYDCLPIGVGQGSAFILAKSLVMDSATRIGATDSGAHLMIVAKTITGFNQAAIATDGGGAFVYVNTVVDQDATDTVLFD